jgi:glutamyl-Q tRNA(Asp) synthetase
VGRYAPSPTGPLHFGSLVAAVASYLDARRAGGDWLLRIDDIDPAREVPGASAAIARALETLELHWDGPILYQSSRFSAYESALEDLLARGLAYRCRCSRRDLNADSTASRYPGTCRELRVRPAEPASIRLRVEPGMICFQDRIQGPQAHPLEEISGDFVVFRRDGLPAYHLATVLDDAYVGVTHIVRGIDLLHVTGNHVYLQRSLGLPTPEYAHIPVVINASGQKLSKQTGATGLDLRRPAKLAVDALTALGLRVPAEALSARPGEVWSWALPHWQITALTGQHALPEPAGR